MLASDVLLIAGLAFAIGSVAVLGRCFGILPDVRGLVTHGPYRWVRHPLYLGELTAVLGIVLGSRAAALGRADLGRLRRAAARPHRLRGAQHQRRVPSVRRVRRAHEAAHPRRHLSPAAAHIRLPRMSYIEDLEEFDAELELRLKREYATVFGLFRYCVLTAEATYLCNRLEMETANSPAYPLVHLTMEDVWVWDKNRPSRIIPRAEVHTTQDVTVEELKPETEIDTTFPPGFELSDE